MTLHKISDREGRGARTGAADTRDWKVRTRADGEDVGVVRDVLVEDSGEARYLDVDLGLLKKRVLVPVEIATIDAGEETVWLDGFDKDGLERIPKFDGDLAKLNADYRAGLLRDYETSAAAASRPATPGAGGGARSDDEAERMEATRAASPRGDSQLGRLGELRDYEVADHHPDVRGWEVIASDDQRVGRVKELVADTAAMKVRYLDVELHRELRRSDEESRVLIPVEHVRLLEDSDSVRLDTMTSQQARDIPTHRGTFDREYEVRLARVFPTDRRS